MGNSDLSQPFSEEQLGAIRRIVANESPGLIVAHGMGLGKTRSSLEAIRQSNLPADVVVPASLRDNYRKEISKWGYDDLPISLHSLENLARGKEKLESPMLVVDEAHRLRNEGKSYSEIKKSPAKKRVFLTGTPMVNKPSDILPLLQQVSDQKMFRRPREEFDAIMEAEEPTGVIGNTVGRMQNVIEDLHVRMMRLMGVNKSRNGALMSTREKLALRKRMLPLMREYIDIKNKKSEDMPDVIHSSVRVPMTPQQDEVSRAVLGELPSHTLKRIRRGLPPDRQDFARINRFLTASRQVMNGDPRMVEGDSPKMKRAVEDALSMAKEDPDTKWVTYSNFLGSGTDLYKKSLEESGIPYGEFTGTISRGKRKQTVDDYNSGKIRALLISGAGSEGLDLKGTRLMQLLEPHWNSSRLDQAAARAVRRKSHEHLPPEKRKVDIRNYYSTMSNGISVDEYLRQMSDWKQQRINRLLRDLAEEPKKDKEGGMPDIRVLDSFCDRLIKEAGLTKTADPFLQRQYAEEKQERKKGEKDKKSRKLMQDRIHLSMMGYNPVMGERGLLTDTLLGAGVGGSTGAAASHVTGADPLKSGLQGAAVGGGGMLIKNIIDKLRRTRALSHRDAMLSNHALSFE
jgi:superfamily II DNA or RNA helicase